MEDDLIESEHMVEKRTVTADHYQEFVEHRLEILPAMAHHVVIDFLIELGAELLLNEFFVAFPALRDFIPSIVIPLLFLDLESLLLQESVGLRRKDKPIGLTHCSQLVFVHRCGLDFIEVILELELITWPSLQDVIVIIKTIVSGSQNRPVIIPN